MATQKKSSRKVSADMHRKLSIISNSSDVSDISQRLGMDSLDFRDTVKNILEFEIPNEDFQENEGLTLSNQKEVFFDNLSPNISSFLSEAKEKDLSLNLTAGSSVDSQIVTNKTEDISSVDIDIEALKHVLDLYNHHKRKISLSKALGQPNSRELIDKNSQKHI